MDREERVILEANYIADNNATVRGVTKKIGIPKSTVYRDMTVALPQLNKKLYNEVRNILAVNKAERHVRGGIATKKKWGGLDQ